MNESQETQSKPEAGMPLGAAPCSAFEMVDATDDEQYFPLGIWLTLEAAIAALDECKDPDDLGSDGCHDDYAKVEIRQHALGWSGHGKKVYQREWSQKYDAAKDEYEWHVRAQCAESFGTRHGFTNSKEPTHETHHVHPRSRRAAGSTS